VIRAGRKRSWAESIVVRVRAARNDVDERALTLRLRGAASAERPGGRSFIRAEVCQERPCVAPVLPQSESEVIRP